MKCIYCGSVKTEVFNSRPAYNGRSTWRRRSCAKCGSTFTTRETALADNFFVMKKNGKRQRFVYEKLFISTFGGLNTKTNNDNGSKAKLAKAIAAEVIKKMIQAKANTGDISTRQLIIWNYKELKKHGRLYADRYIYYSEYRLQVAIQEGLIKIGQ